MAEKTSAMDCDLVRARWAGAGREPGGGALLLRLWERVRHRDRCLRRPPGPTGGTAGKGGRAFFPVWSGRDDDVDDEDDAAPAAADAAAVVPPSVLSAGP